jgi:hypothetical protein
MAGKPTLPEDIGDTATSHENNPANTKRTKVAERETSQSTAPAVQRGVNDDDLLIPGERNPATGATPYYTRGQYVEKYGPVTQDQLDQKAVLIKSPSGTYLTKPTTYFTTYGGDSDDKDIRQQTKDANFKARMAELGLSDKPFNELNEGRLKGADAIIETPGGTRQKFKNYAHPEQAGVSSPDILARKSDGSYEAFYPKTREDIKSVGDLQQKYAEVYVKTKGHNYEDVATHDRRQGPRATERAFAYFKGEVFHNERNDLPKVLYRTAPDEYGSKQDYLAGLRHKDGPGAKIDYTKADILFQAPAGKSLLSPKFMKRIDPVGYEAFLKKEGIDKKGPDGKDILTTKIDHTRPQVLVAIDNRLVGADRVRAEGVKMGISRDAPLAKEYGPGNVFVENLGKDGKTTGNYRDAPSAATRRSNSEIGRLEQLGVSKSEGQIRLAGVFSRQAAARNQGQSGVEPMDTEPTPIRVNTQALAAVNDPARAQARVPIERQRNRELDRGIGL